MSQDDVYSVESDDLQLRIDYISFSDQGENQSQQFLNNVDRSAQLDYR